MSPPTPKVSVAGGDMTGYSDDLTLALQGDDRAFEALYREVAPRARRIAYRIVRDADAADDLVQEAFYLVLRSMRSGGGPREQFAGYVFTTTKRLAFQHCRTRTALAGHDDPAALRTGDDPYDAEPKGASDALATLPPRWRTILWLVEVERYSPAELAAPMSMTPSAVASLAHRARRALRTAYLAAG
ncbi:sigma-70 family RNA polymerase sigma factor [Jiangella rhizosphaerae]|uniref:Sigma-70 family RNA polymerase sigma factor n=2 Tax=Jiangella rhizosphaerae TaxID=2293569 RepID=A0A418KGC2_9ACTN|nr:sigma-70 family RNA polymerase sigma factor [Jiangella rhizosphaerae]